MISTMPPKKCQIKYQLQVRIEKFLKFMERQCKRHCKKSGFEKYRFRPEDDYPDTFQEQIYHVFPKNQSFFRSKFGYFRLHVILSAKRQFIQTYHTLLGRFITWVVCYHGSSILPKITHCMHKLDETFINTN